MGSPFRNSPRGNCLTQGDFEFLSVDELMDIDQYESPRQPGRSPVRAMMDDVVVPAVMTALGTVVSSEGLFVVNIAKSVLTGAAATLTSGSAGLMPGVAVGALVAGGIIAYQKIRSRSMSALDVIKSLSPQHQKMLISRLGKGLRGLGVKNLASDIINRKEVRDAALSILSAFLEEKYRVKLTSS